MPEDHPELECVGPIVRLQVQTEPLKHGQRPDSWYVPDAIASVQGLRIDSGGVWGIAPGGSRELADVHHRDHPRSRFRGENGISVGFTSHYALMRKEYGDALIDGIAGENILVETDRLYTEVDLAAGIVVITGDRHADFTDIQVATPCVEFAKFCLGYEPSRRADAAVTQAVRALHNGVRGFYGTLAIDEAEQPRLTVGDVLYRVLH